MGLRGHLNEKAEEFKQKVSVREGMEALTREGDKRSGFGRCCGLAKDEVKVGMVWWVLEVIKHVLGYLKPLCALSSSEVSSSIIRLLSTFKIWPKPSDGEEL